MILQSVARVGEVAADDIPPTSHSLPLTNVLAPGRARAPGLTAAEALSGTPATEQHWFRCRTFWKRTDRDRD